MTRRLAVFCCVACLTHGIASGAQQTPPAPTAEGAAPPATRQSGNLEDLPDCGQGVFEKKSADHVRYTGDVECELPDGVRLSADEIDIFDFNKPDAARISASGNVVFDGPEGHIAAARLEYDTATGTGTFYDATGILALGDSVNPADLGSRDTDVYFEGEQLERLGPRRYRVTRGKWTTCAQPTPRWHFDSGGMVINLEDYVVATSTVFRVKGVPLFWLPWMYYPIQSDDRATGFLMPTYGTATFRGQTISNGFFWAIGRSHDATFLHDWSTRAGQGAGMEYRYVTGPQSSGTFRPYFFKRSETESTEDGVVTTLPATTSYELTGTAVQMLGRGVVARGRVDYFSDVVNQQLLHQDFYQASRRNRLVEGGVTAPLGPLVTSVVYQRNDVVNDVDDTFVYGSTPRASAALAPQQLFASPIYLSVNTEYAYQPYRRFLNGDLIQDDSFGRFDVAPSVRMPLSRLSFLSVNASAGYRTTYYSRQAGTTTTTQPGAYLRQYATVRTDIVGPVATRIFDLPEGGFAERIKHVIEPAVTLDVTSPIRDFRRTPIQSDVSDFIVGGASRVTYRLTNRLFSRGRTVNGVRGSTREFATVEVQQTFYSNPESSRYDGTYVSVQGAGVGRDLSPVALTARVSPSSGVDANARIEYDVSGRGLQVLTTGTTLTAGQTGVNVNYSRQRIDRTQPASSFVTSTMQTRFLDDRLTTSYALSWDVARSSIVSQGIVGSYMAQCCGIQAEYQQFNYPTGLGLPPSTDRRFNLSFVLSGVGTVSNVFGAFGGR